MRLKLQKNNWLRRPKTLSGTSKPVPSKTPYNHTPSSEDEERERANLLLITRPGVLLWRRQMRYQRATAAVHPVTATSPGSGYVSQAAEDMQRIVSQLAEESAAIRYEEELSKSSRMNQPYFLRKHP